MRRKPKLKDVARLAGVSTATVDRVVNERPGVQDHTRQHVLSVMTRMLEPCDNQADGRATSGHNAISLDFVIPDSGNAFMSELITQLQSHAGQRHDVALTFHRPEGIDAANIADTLKAIGKHSKGVGLIGLDRPAVRDMVRDLVRRGTPVVTMASDIRNVPRVNYIGIDNHAAGRLAGYLTGQMTGPDRRKVALMLGSRAYLGHEEREMGFRSILRESFPGLDIVAEREVEEDAERARQALLSVLKLHPDLNAVYCIGAGQPGIAKAIEQTGRTGSLFFVGHGLSSDTRRFLTDGTMNVVIDEDIEVEAREAIDSLVRASMGDQPLTSSTIRINAVFRENVPTEF